MNAVDLGRVGACVLKHAVTGEVRPGKAQGGERLLAPDPEPWQLTWAGVEVLRGPMSSRTGCGCSRWVHRGTIRRTSRCEAWSSTLRDM